MLDGPICQANFGISAQIYLVTSEQRTHSDGRVEAYQIDCGLRIPCREVYGIFSATDRGIGGGGVTGTGRSGD